MIQIPADLAKLYTSFMEQKGVETDQHRYYIKRKQAHHAVSLFYEMGHLSGRKTRNGTSYGKSAAYGRTEPEISSSHTKKVAFYQAVFSGRSNFSISLGNSHWIPAFAGMTGAHTQSSFPYWPGWGNDSALGSIRRGWEQLLILSKNAELFAVVHPIVMWF